MAESKFDMSLLEPVDEQKSSSNSSPGWDASLLTPIETPNENKFEPPKQEGVGTWLPRDILIGLANQGHSTLNMPHDLVKGAEQLGQEFGDSVNKALPIEQYIGNNKLPGSPSMMQSMVDKFNKDHNVPDELQNKNWNKPLSERIPYQQDYDFAKMLGQEGTPTTGSFLIQKGIEHAPELFSLASLAKHLPITSKGIMNKMSRNKLQALNEAKSDYGNLFSEANKQGITHVPPPDSAYANRARITANSQSKHNKSFNEYMKNPTLENAHWAQSELGSLERHLDTVASKNGLTPSQHKTLKAVQASRKDIRDSMFSNNAFGANPLLGKEYENLAAKYKENVVPYTRLEQLNETEAKRMKPKTAVKQLLNDDQFMIELSQRYPGLKLHTQGAKNMLKTILGTGGTLIGYEGIKKLFT